jgi:tetratricopeptide (TPR) repeat protein
MRSIDSAACAWLTLRGNRARDLQQFGVAAALYEAALALRPGRNGLRVQLGNMLKDAGEWARAEQVYLKAIEFAPDESDIHLQLGHALKLSGRLREALKAYQRATELDPRSSSLKEIEFIKTLRLPADPDPQGQPDTGDLPARGSLASGPDAPGPLKSVIYQGNLFDTRWYLQQYPEVEALGSDPLDHYLTVGERSGKDPSPRFRACDYFDANPDVRDSGMGALEHYALFGRREGRRKAPAKSMVDLPDTLLLQDAAPRIGSRIAVVVHVYYPDLWPEIAASLRNVGEQFDLYVSLVKGQSDHIERDVQEQFEGAFTFVFPNHGRDMFPFVYLCNTGVLSEYEAVCKVHTKKSPQRVDGDAWRQLLIGPLLGSRERIIRIVDSFRTEPSVGIVAAGGSLLGCENWGVNAHNLSELAHRAALHYSVKDLRFAAGSMFWIRGEVLSAIASLKLSETDFELEAGQLDGTMAHAVERFFSILVRHFRLGIASAD